MHFKKILSGRLPNTAIVAVTTVAIFSLYLTPDTFGDAIGNFATSLVAVLVALSTPTTTTDSETEGETTSKRHIRKRADK